jgi:tRNA (cmo5U34)-methyltransferase
VQTVTTNDYGTKWPDAQAPNGNSQRLPLVAGPITIRERCKAFKSIFDGLESDDMDGFEQSSWSQPESSQEYRDTADHIIQERRTQLDILASFYRSFVTGAGPKRILDLGCGDGILTETLCAQDEDANVIVTDGSNDMLDAARNRLAGLPVIEFCLITFEEIIAGGFQRGPFDFIASSFAIHHLDLAHKALLFQRIIELLKPGSHFLNIDVALAEYAPYTDWQFRLWQEWIVSRQRRLGLGTDYAHVPEEARVKPENHYDTLQGQLDALRSVGFVDVDCHYRYSVFSVYGGKKPNLL